MACYHCNMMAEYYAARNAQEEHAEDVSHGYKTEREEFYNQEPRVNFKDFLQARMMSRD